MRSTVVRYGICFRGVLLELSVSRLKVVEETYYLVYLSVCRIVFGSESSLHKNPYSGSFVAVARNTSHSDFHTFTNTLQKSHLRV